MLKKNKYLKKNKKIVNPKKTISFKHKYNNLINQ